MVGGFCQDSGDLDGPDALYAPHVVPRKQASTRLPPLTATARAASHQGQGRARTHPHGFSSPSRRRRRPQPPSSAAPGFPSSGGIYSSNMHHSSEAAEASTSTSYNMDSFPEAAEAILPVSASVPNWMLATDDQHFLLLSIMGIYFGPDLKYEMCKKSALQLIAEDLPPYTLDQLAGSYMKAVDVERIYYYVLRNADQSVRVKMPLLQNFVQGCLFFPSEGSVVNHWQFPDLFAEHLHPQSRLRNRYKVIKNIVFINNPEISFIKPEDLERFKRLARLEDLSLDRDAAMSFTIGVSRPVIKPEEGPSNKKAPKKTQSKSQHYQRVDAHKEVETSSPTVPVSGLAGEGPSNRELPKNSVDDPVQTEDPGPSMQTLPEPISAIPHGKSSSNSSPGIGVGQPVERVGPAMLLLPSYPTVEEWTNVVNAVKGGIAVTGTAAERPIGPVVGLVDVGENEEAYLFRVSLPGISRHPVSCCMVGRDSLFYKQSPNTQPAVLQHLDLHILLHQLPMPCDILAVVDENVLVHQPNVLDDVILASLPKHLCFPFSSFLICLATINLRPFFTVTEHFHINIETNGTVLIEGETTTGGRRSVTRYSQEFEMLTQNHCPSGAFSVTFQLPGPVGERQLSGSFWSEGIFEGIVEKTKMKSS